MLTTDTRETSTGAACRPAPVQGVAKRYIGLRLWDGNALVMVQDVLAGGKLGMGRPLPAWPMDGVTSPGFSWGSYASAATCLALAILADYLGDDPPPLLYEKAINLIAGLDGDANFVITTRQLENWLAQP